MSDSREGWGVTRREFIKKGSAVAVGATLAGVAPTGFPLRRARAATAKINFAYILSDHHAPLMVLASHGKLFRDKYNIYLKPVIQYKLYDFYYDGARLASIQLIPTQKGPDVERLVAQGSVDIAISGTQAIIMSVDRGVKTKIVAPCQTAGNVFVVRKDVPIHSWKQFVQQVKGAKKQFKIGTPGPQTVASIIFRWALDFEGITYTEGFEQRDADVFFINMKGHGNLVAALTDNITQAIIGAQPFPSVTIKDGVGRFIINLQDAPPVPKWHGHACCSIEATERFRTKERNLMAKTMELMVLGIRACEQDKDLAARTCAAWLGVNIGVEQLAMPTLTYTATPTRQWVDSVHTYVATMDRMNMFNGLVRGKRGTELDPLLFDFQYLDEAKKNLAAKDFISL